MSTLSLKSHTLYSLYLLIHKANVSITFHDSLLITSTFPPSKSSGESAKSREGSCAQVQRVLE